MNFIFENQVVVVTGGTRGIGRGLAQSFLAAGATVVATYAHNDSRAQEFLQANEHYGNKVQIRKFDIAQEDQVAAFFKEMDQLYPSLEILINNSGIRKDNLLALMEEKDWDAVVDTNLKGTYLMCKHAIPLFMKNRYGRIINMSSVGGRLGLPGQANYAASKAAQVALSQSLSKELAKKRITVNCVAPGFIETDLIADLPKELKDEYQKTVPMKRFGKVEEVVAGVLFLASKEASYITGTTLEISGGL